jgi:hypothetical protein
MCAVTTADGARAMPVGAHAERRLAGALDGSDAAARRTQLAALAAKPGTPRRSEHASRRKLACTRAGRISRRSRSMSGEPRRRASRSSPRGRPHPQLAVASRRRRSLPDTANPAPLRGETPVALFSVFEVGAARFELATSRTRTVRATKLRYAPEGTHEDRLERRCFENHDDCKRWRWQATEIKEAFQAMAPAMEIPEGRQPPSAGEGCVMWSGLSSSGESWRFAFEARRALAAPAGVAGAPRRSSAAHFLRALSACVSSGTAWKRSATSP